MAAISASAGNWARAGAPPLAAGIDFGQVEDGRFAAITGFLDHVAVH